MKLIMLFTAIDLYRQDLRVFIPIVGGLIGFIIFWFTQKSNDLRQKFIDKYGIDNGSARFIIFTKYLGGFSMGVIPALVFFIVFPDSSLSYLGLGIHKEKLATTVLLTIGLIAVIIPIISISSRKPANFINYPEIRVKEWDGKLVRGYLGAWAVYLLGYEFLFRGLLLFPLVDKIGFWPAVAVNIGMYSGTHIPKGLGETIGAIPLSIVLCFLCVQTGNIWIAYFVHIAIAWTSNLTAIKYNPKMKFIKK
jgi:membrane protease YdiL (CAAX protease family)